MNIFKWLFGSKVDKENETKSNVPDTPISKVDHKVDEFDPQQLELCEKIRELISDKFSLTFGVAKFNLVIIHITENRYFGTDKKNYFIPIDYKIHDFEYYERIVNAYKLLYAVYSHSNNIHMSITDSKIELIHLHNRYVNIPDNDVLRNINFNKGSDTPKELLSILRNHYINNIITKYSNTLTVEFDTINIESLKCIIADFKIDCDRTNALIKNEIIEKINTIRQFFPDIMYSTRISKDGASETVLSTTKPVQDISGSIKISDILFRGDFFILIPCVMYKIETASITVDDIINEIIGGIKWNA